MRSIVSILLTAVVCGAALGQELPGTPRGGLPPALRGTYEGSGTVLPVAGGERSPAPRPFFTLVPDLSFRTGASDNVFLTPDVLGFRAQSDGFVSVAPRLRALFRLDRSLGLVADYTLTAQQFFANGSSLSNAGSVFLGYRPANERHAELGVRGGTARVSEFEISSVNEGYVFGAATYGWTPWTSASVSASGGAREFPDRTRTKVRPFIVGVGPLTIPLPLPGTTTERRGQRDVVINASAGLSHNYSPHGGVRASYDFTRNDSEFDELSSRSRRLSFAAVNVWSSWLASQLAYSAAFRRFPDAAAGSLVVRRDTLHDLTVGLIFTPRLLTALRFTRSASLHLDGDFLFSTSNVDAGAFERKFVGLTLEIGLPPLTGDKIGRAILPGLYGAPPSVSFSSNAQPAD